MLKLEDVTEIIKGHEETLGSDAMAEIGVKLLEKDVPDASSDEFEKMKKELEDERAGRAADKQEYVDRINKFIYGGDPGGEPPKPDPVKQDPVVEEKSFYERMYKED